MPAATEEAGTLPSEQKGKRNKIKMAIEALQPGMVIAEPVMNSYGAVVAWQDTSLEEPLIKRLASMGIPHLLVYTDEVVDFGLAQQREWVPQTKAEVFEYEYTKDTDSFKDMFLQISSGGLLEPEKTDAIVASVLNRQHDAAHIVDCVMQVRTVDEYTYHHCINVSMLAMMLGKWMRMPPSQLPGLVRAGLLHDVGKSRVPLSILNKPGPLAPEELQEMKRHAEYGYQLVRLSEQVAPEIAMAVLTHHEREDGTGYPLGIRADKLGVYAKILAIVDVFDAMTANRVYRKHEPVFKVFELMQHGSFGRLDPIVLDVFLTNITHYYVGRRVVLSDGAAGEVVFMNRQDFSRPVVQTMNGFVDLLSNKRLSIVEIG
jgi:putative nucleotidyltransferase with HDIG domain